MSLASSSSNRGSQGTEGVIAGALLLPWTSQLLDNVRLELLRAELLLIEALTATFLDLAPVPQRLAVEER